MRTYDIKNHESYLYVDENYNFYSHDRVTSYLRKGKVVTRHTKGKQLNIHLIGGHNSKYPEVHYKVNNQTIHVLCHLAIANTFIPNPNNLPCVNHKDGDKMNWYPDNLEWCTYQENSQHALHTGLWKPWNAKGNYVRNNNVNKYRK